MTLNSIFLFLTLFLFFVSSLSSSIDESSSILPIQKNVTFFIEHRLSNLDGQVFSLRSRQQLVTRNDGKLGFLLMDKNSISKPDEISLIKKNLKELDESYLYTIRLSFESTDSSESSNILSSSIPFCELQRSGFKELIHLHIDSFGYPIAMNYGTVKMKIPLKCDVNEIPSTISFTTKFKFIQANPSTSSSSTSNIFFGMNLQKLRTDSDGIAHAEAMTLPAVVASPRPPFIPKVKTTSSEIKDEEEKPQQKSFLRQYWYIVLALIAYLFLAPNEPPKPAQPQGNKGATKTATAPTIATKK